jgi:hypothetical protein
MGGRVVASWTVFRCFLTLLLASNVSSIRSVAVLTGGTRFTVALSGRSIEHARARSDGLAEVALKANRDSQAQFVSTRLVLFLSARNRSECHISACIPRRARLALSGSDSCRVSAIWAGNTVASVPTNVSGAVLSFRTVDAGTGVDDVVASGFTHDVVSTPLVFAGVSRRALVGSGVTNVSLVASGNRHRLVEGVAYLHVSGRFFCHVEPSLDHFAFLRS